MEEDLEGGDRPVGVTHRTQGETRNPAKALLPDKGGGDATRYLHGKFVGRGLFKALQQEPLVNAKVFRDDFRRHIQVADEALGLGVDVPCRQVPCEDIAIQVENASAMCGGVPGLHAYAPCLPGIVFMVAQLNRAYMIDQPGEQYKQNQEEHV